MRMHVAVRPSNGQRKIINAYNAYERDGGTMLRRLLSRDDWPKI